MTQPVSAQPELYSAGESPPKLNGCRCDSCGRSFFPPQSYGCQACGASSDHLKSFFLEGRGFLQSFATVHLHQRGGIQTPFTVGSIVLDDGPTILGILTCATDEGLSIGDRVYSVLVPQSKQSDGREVVEIRFAKEPVER